VRNCQYVNAGRNGYFCHKPEKYPQNNELTGNPKYPQSIEYKVPKSTFDLKFELCTARKKMADETSHE